MRATTIRFTPELWELLEQEARREGVSVAQYVRDAAMFRAAFGLGERSGKAGSIEDTEEDVLSHSAPFRRRGRNR